MNTNDIAVAIDAEISRLQQARALLSGTDTTVKRKPGRPTAASLPNKATSFNSTELSEKPQKRRTMSAEGRARIAEAQKARWARTRKTEKYSARKTASVASTKVTAKGVARKATIKKAVPKKKAPQLNAASPSSSAS